MKPLRVVVAALLAAAALQAHAGRDCEQRRLTVVEIDQGLALAERTARALDATGAQVLLLARAGQDLSRWGLRWSHLGFAYRSGDAAGSFWRVVHKLNHCGTGNAALYRQGLGEFFLDHPHRYEAAYVALNAEAQARLLPLLRDNTQVARLHERRYNLVAYPWSPKYQQSNQWAIETLAFALDPAARARPQAQTWLQAKDYEPTTLRIGPLERLGANLGRANIAFDDHPKHKRFSDRIETVTVDSVFAWLPRAGLGSAPVVVR